MKLWLLLLLIIGCFLLTGCPSYSLYPLYIDQDAVVVPALEGTWVDPGSDVKDGVTFQKSGDHGYAMIVDDPSTKFRQTYDVRLVRSAVHGHCLVRPNAERSKSRSANRCFRHA